MFEPLGMIESDRGDDATAVAISVKTISLP
jgi:hypothetical protein